MIQKYVPSEAKWVGKMGWHPVNNPVPTGSMMEAAISNLRLYI